MKFNILTSSQAKLFDILSNDSLISQNFYLSGGTALAEFYLQHRLSDDFLKLV